MTINPKEEMINTTKKIIDNIKVIKCNGIVDKTRTFKNKNQI